MNFFEAVKTLKPIKRSGHINFVDAKHILNRLTNNCYMVKEDPPYFELSPNDIFSDDWEVQTDEFNLTENEKEVLLRLLKRLNL